VKNAVGIIILVAFAFASICTAQSASEDAKILKAFTIPIPIDGGPVWATVVNDRTSEILWRNSPSKESLLSSAAGTGLSLYVMGLVTKDFEVIPEYSIKQDNATVPGRAINIRNLSGGVVKQGEVILGLIEFSTKVDVTRPFTLEFSRCHVETSLNSDDVGQWGSISSMQDGSGGPPGH